MNFSKKKDPATFTKHYPLFSSLMLIAIKYFNLTILSLMDQGATERFISKSKLSVWS